MTRVGYPRCKSRFAGVTWDKEKNKWKARITINRRRTYLGHFTSEQDAARAYDNAVHKFYE